MTNAPQGVAALLHQVPAAVERVRREIVLARFLGKLAVDQGARELRERLDAALNPASHPEAEFPVEPPLAPRRSAATEPTVDAMADVIADPDTSAARPAETSASVPAVESLALSDYDHLPASDIVGKLPSLDIAERDAIEAYERAGRGRRTVLGKLEQLKGDA